MLMMDVDFITGIGWRDIVLVAVAIIGVYLVLLVMRLVKVAGKRRRAAQKEGKPQPASPQQGQTAHPAAPENAPEFAQALARSHVETELESLRRESAHQRDELARLSEEISRLKAARNVSPLYNEAMTLAQQGMSADGIAGHCGISIGEAELVAALTRSKNEFGRHEQGEDRNERNTDS